jgi:hypothetical protein
MANGKIIITNKVQENYLQQMLLIDAIEDQFKGRRNKIELLHRSLLMHPCLQ